MSWSKIWEALQGKYSNQMSRKITLDYLNGVDLSSIKQTNFIPEKLC